MGRARHAKTEKEAMEALVKAVRAALLAQHVSPDSMIPRAESITLAQAYFAYETCQKGDEASEPMTVTGHYTLNDLPLVTIDKLNGRVHARCTVTDGETAWRVLAIETYPLPRPYTVGHPAGLVLDKLHSPPPAGAKLRVIG